MQAVDHVHLQQRRRQKRPNDLPCSSSVLRHGLAALRLTTVQRLQSTCLAEGGGTGDCSEADA